jgi:hypothetical protein
MNANDALGNSLNAIAADTQRQMAAREKEQEALLKAQRQAVVDIKSTSILTDIEVQARNKQEELNRDTTLSGSQRFNMYAEWRNNAAKETLDTITEPDLRAAVEKSWYPSHKTALSSYQNTTFNQETHEAMAALNATNDAMITQAGGMLDIKDFNTLTEDLNRMIGAKTWALGDKATEETRKTIEAAGENFMYNLLDEDPRKLLNLLGTGQLDHVLKPGAKGTWEQKVVTKARQIKSAAKLGIRLSGVSAVTNVMTKDLDDGLDPRDVDAALQAIQRHPSRHRGAMTAYLKDAKSRAEGGPGVPIPNQLPHSNKPIFVYDPKSPISKRDQFEIQATKALNNLFGTNAKTGKPVFDFEEALNDKTITPDKLEEVQAMLIYGQQNKLIRKAVAGEHIQNIALVTSALETKGRYTTKKQNAAKQKTYNAIVLSANQANNTLNSIFGFKPFGSPAKNVVAQNNYANALAQYKSLYRQKYGKEPDSSAMEKLKVAAKTKAMK